MLVTYEMLTCGRHPVSSVPSIFTSCVERGVWSRWSRRSLLKSERVVGGRDGGRERALFVVYAALQTSIMTTSHH